MGARFPWNSSSLTAREQPWRGWQEHLGPDIAYAVDQYVRATGDEGFYLDHGAALIIETAAYWPGRTEWDAARQAYVMRRLTGPDEIHTGIDNNATTNVMAAWHLRRALAAVEDLRSARRWPSLRRRIGLEDRDLEQWGKVAEGLVTNFDKRRGFHEQFDGYFGLKEGKVDRAMTQMQYTGPVLGALRPTKVSKQADVPLLYLLFREDFPEAVRRAGYRYYEPRCSHASSLSRSVFAAVAAQAGETREAYRLFLEAAEADFGPRAECDSGIHAACLGGNWQAVVMGFAGLALRDGRLALRPRLPASWRRLSFSLQWHGRVLNVSMSSRSTRLRASGGTVDVDVDGTTRRVGKGTVTLPACARAK
jgi:trehalose/maltose hydrolase-like predicted phosphorylase